MSAPERGGQATHGHNIPYARFGGKHSRTPGTDAQQASGNQRSYPDSTPNSSRPLWDQVTAKLYTVPGNARPQPESSRHRAVSADELFRAALDGARTAQVFRDVPSERERLEPRLTPKETPTLPEQMFAIGARFTLLHVSSSDQRAIYDKLANYPNELIPIFHSAFFGARTVEEAVEKLPLDYLRQFA